MGVSRRCRAILNSFHSLSNWRVSASNPATVPFNSFQPFQTFQTFKIRNCWLEIITHRQIASGCLGFIYDRPPARGRA